MELEAVEQNSFFDMKELNDNTESTNTKWKFVLLYELLI